MVQTIKASDILTKEFKSIHEFERISKALNLFDDSNNTLVVFDNKGKYRGVLPERNILRSSLNPEEARIKHFMINTSEITKETTAPECAKLMLQANTRCLPVMEKSKLVGIVTDSNLLEAVASKGIGNQKVSLYMSISPIIVSPDESVATVLYKFREYHISRMPVIEDGKIVGIITLHDLVKKVIQKKKLPAWGFVLAEKDTVLEWAIEGIMNKTPLMVNENARISEVIEKMIENKAGSIIVADNEEKLKGIITRKDLLEPIAEKAVEEEHIININTNAQDVDRQYLKDIILHFIKKYPVKLKNSSFNIYIRTHKERMRGLPLIYTRMRVHIPTGWFTAREEGWGIENSVKNCLLKIERQIIKKLELIDDRRRKKFLEYVDVERL